MSPQKQTARGRASRRSTRDDTDYVSDDGDHGSDDDDEDYEPDEPDEPDAFDEPNAFDEPDDHCESDYAPDEGGIVDGEDNEDDSDADSVPNIAAAYRAKRSSAMYKDLFQSRDLSIDKIKDCSRAIIHLYESHSFEEQRKTVRKELMCGQPLHPEKAHLPVALETARMLSEALADRFDRAFRSVNERGVPRVYKYGTTMLDVSASFLVCKIKEVSNDVLNTVSNVAPLHDALVSSAPRSDTWLAVILKTTKLLDDEIDNKRFLRLLLFAACTAMFDAAYAEYPTNFFQKHTARLLKHVDDSRHGHP